MEAYIIAIAIITAIYVLLALGLNLQYGLTGLINFGHVGFFCVGAYTAALLSKHEVSPLLAFPVAALLTALAAWPLGVVSRHGGTIKAESPHSGGARFSVRLPAFT